MISGEAKGRVRGAALDSWIAGALALAALALSLHSLAEHDLFWQLATGRWIAEHGPPEVDPWNFAFPALPWIEPRWLFCLALWLVQSGLGWNALVVAGAAIVLGSLALLLFLPVPAWSRNLGAAAAIAAAGSRFAVRPEIFTFVFLVALLVALERFRLDARFPIFALAVPLQLLWVNVHTLFILGPAVVALWLAGEEIEARLDGARRANSRARRRSLRLLLAALAAACLANPYFLRGALFPFELFSEIRGDDRLGRSITEFLSPFAVADSGYFFVSYLVVAAFAAASFFGRREAGSARLPRAFVFLAFAYLSALAQRNVALFALVAGVALAANLGEAARAPAVLPRAAAGSARGLTLVFALAMIFSGASDLFYRDGFEVRRFGLGVAPLRFPFGALEFAGAHGIDGAMLHDIGDGGAILWARGGRSVFVDGRLEVYGAARLSDLLPLIELGQGLPEATRRFGFRAAVVGTSGQPGLLLALERSPDWRPVYYDASHVLYLHVEPANEAAIRDAAIDWRSSPPSPPAIPEGLPRWRPVFSQHDLAAREALMLGRLYVQVGALDKAAATIARGARLEPRNVELRLYRYLLARPGDPAAPVPAGLARYLDRLDVQRVGAEIAEQRGAPALARDDYARLSGRPAASFADFDGWIRAALAAGDTEGARQAVRLQTSRFPASLNAWNNRGVLAYRAGDFEEAQSAFSASLGIDPRQSAVLRQRALAQAALGQTDAAIADLERVLELSAGDAPARETLVRLRAGTSAAGAPGP